MLTVFGHDPGTRNYGMAIVSFKNLNGRVKYKIRMTGKLQSTANIQGTTGKEMGITLDKYLREVKKISKGYEVDEIVAERFMSRGNGGTLIESVNMMLGQLNTVSRNKITLLSASTWKNRVNKFFDLKDFYTQVRVEAHEVDAVLMSMYCAEQILDLDILPRFKKKNERTNLIKVIESCTTSQLKKPKRKKR